jgi:hypothetical protein
MVKNCIADMLEDVKQMVINHAHITSTSPDDELFAFASEEPDSNPFCKSVTYGSGKQGKCKPGRLCKWTGEQAG